MNRYPLWKYILIAVTLVLGFIFTLPNLYGESPAIQVSPLRTTAKADTGLMQQVEESLKAGKISYQGVFMDQASVKVRFADTDTQLKAKDIVQAKLGTGYVVALNLLPSSPKWLTSIGALPMYLGLDLRGGVHFLLQVDMKAALDKAVERYTGDIRTTLRDKKIYYAGISRTGQSVEVKFRDADSRAKAEKEISNAYGDLLLKEQDVEGEFKLIGTLKVEAQKRLQELALQQNITTLRNRVNELGVAEPIIQQQGIDRVVVQLPGVQDTAKAKDILGRTATLEVRLVDEEHSDPATLQAAIAGQVPFGSELYTERDGRPVLVKKNVVLTGEYINDASPGFDSQTSQAAVHVNLDGRGARIFKNITRENVGKRMAILLVEKGHAEVITAPVIREEIGGGRVQITGMQDAVEANDVALLLRAGALAAPMEIVEERTVGPSLGADNITKGFNSNIYGFVAIAIFMIMYYNLFGVISTFALAVNVLFLLSILSLLQATLTLPGMAGIALTVGMAIDANVLINERIREELRSGMSPQAAIYSGYERAFGTILDSNITTLIAGVALFWLGSGPVKGFAVVLCLGILTSMFSAVMVSRGIVNLVYGRQARLTKVSI
ncbi:protein translocase subunit SecD [Sulfurirhabdus autotrophica]|uniref:Protein translocase subunit SecD n=1 Tax=Sulfurirhabdus autotrophica TaxID=1706046 RepID=A0A4R3Y126_9PROT|nr:protein translocase subunit SecD [Sulfurirhabdus autotrophica]TCV85805.1 preprotein translocase subunit SecD [Sulfurirhabdus autotrophica]